MADRITVKDCETIAGFVGDYMGTLGLLGDGERLVIESGSATYGRAWKVFVTGGRFGTAWHQPQFGSLYSGSARELFGKLAAVSAALGAVHDAQGQAYARAKFAGEVTA